MWGTKAFFLTLFGAIERAYMPYEVSLVYRLEPAIILNSFDSRQQWSTRPISCRWNRRPWRRPAAHLRKAFAWPGKSRPCTLPWVNLWWPGVIALHDLTLQCDVRNGASATCTHLSVAESHMFILLWLTGSFSRCASSGEMAMVLNPELIRYGTVCNRSFHNHFRIYVVWDGSSTKARERESK